MRPDCFKTLFEQYLETLEGCIRKGRHHGLEVQRDNDDDDDNCSSFCSHLGTEVL